MQAQILTCTTTYGWTKNYDLTYSGGWGLLLSGTGLAHGRNSSDQPARSLRTPLVIGAVAHGAAVSDYSSNCPLVLWTYPLLWNRLSRSLLQQPCGVISGGTAYIVLYHCDNERVVALMATRSSKHPHLTHLLRCLFFIEAHYDFQLSCVHIPGRCNELADALSLNNVSTFLLKAPAGVSPLIPAPPPLIDLLLDKITTGSSVRRV